ncbi:MAG: Tn3 family transposase [Acetobacteraceae bacterium]
MATARVGIEEDTSAARDQATKAAAAGLPRNHFAKVESGQIKLKQPDAMPVPRGLRHLSDTIRASMPRVRIEDLLQGVDEWCGFIRALQPLGGYVPRSGDDAHRAPLATLIAHGTNLGLAAMTERRLPDR